jgi:dipeptidyl aminopeptidase/acylaminoacyl peptidase
MPVRNVDEWASPTKLTVFCSTLSLASSVPHLGEPFNILSGLDQDFKTFGGMHMTQHGIALVAGDHTPSVAGISLSTVFYLPAAGIVSSDHSTRIALKAPGFHGFSSSPQIWDNGSKISFLQKRHGWLEDDPTLIVTCELWNSSLKFSHCEVYRDEANSTTLSPLEMKILDDGNPVFIAEDMAEVKLFSVHRSSAAKFVGRSFTKGWSLEAFHLLTDQSDQSKKILAIGSTLNVSRRWATLDSSGVILRVISEATEEEQRLHIDKTSYESIQWLGADEIPVQAWLVKPRTFDPMVQYPLLYCIHGGPSAAINNAWPAGYWRNLNFALLAEQGYIVVVPNASGSTGFGHQYAKRVLNDWGGRPYVDHVRGFSYIQSTLPYVDTKRSVAFGMSYGGFMINWMNGQPLGREFKAMISECGFANNSAQYVSI